MRTVASDYSLASPADCHAPGNIARHPRTNQDSKTTPQPKRTVPPTKKKVDRKVGKEAVLHTQDGFRER